MYLVSVKIRLKELMMLGLARMVYKRRWVRPFVFILSLKYPVRGLVTAIPDCAGAFIFALMNGVEDNDATVMDQSENCR